MRDIDRREIPVRQDRAKGLAGSGRFPALDGIRGVAVLAVMCYHFTEGYPRRYIEANSLHGVLAQFLNVSWAGVDLFFVLSGFLITGILIDSKGAPNYFRNFYMRRVLRIMPLYYGLLIVLFVIAPHLHTFDRAVRTHLWEQVWLWFYAANFYQVVATHSLMKTFHVQHLWSLAVEEQFYLMWPFVIFRTRAKTAAKISVFCIFAALILRIVLWEGHVSAETIWNLTFCRMDGLAVGALCAFLVRRSASRRYLFAGARVTSLVAAAGLLGILWWRRTWYWDDPIMETFGIWLLSIGFGGVLLLSLDAPGTNTVRWIFRRRTLMLFGFYSYAIYVFHYPLILLDERLFPISSLSAHLHSLTLAVGVYTLASTAISFTAAWLSWHLYEKHFIKLKVRFALPAAPAPALVPVSVVARANGPALV